MDENFLAQSYGKSLSCTDIPNPLFKEYNVKKGLRNEDGTGVRVGLTKVSDVVGYRYEGKEKMDADGELYFRGYRINDLVAGKKNSHFGYEETSFLLLFGYLPNSEELKKFREILSSCYLLPDEFLKMNLLRMPSKNLMTSLQQAVLTFYNYDQDPDNVDVFETLLKGLNIIAKLPSIACYAYQSKMHYYNRESLIIHYPRKEYSIAENILYMIREDRKFTEREANLLDVLLMLHADHGGGNNSTFTNVVISSTGTDIYASMSASIGALKGPKHGGANIRCQEMLQAIQAEIGITTDEVELEKIVRRILNKDFYDKSGLIYGIGHAVYTLSDPRANILKNYCQELAKETGRTAEYEFLVAFEQVAKRIIYEEKGKCVSNNVDFYSGFAYDMLKIPKDMYTPLFVCSRVSGWLAHNIENKLYDGRIMRPATKYVGNLSEYKEMGER